MSAEQLERLLGLWAAHPEERALGALVLPALGLEAGEPDLRARYWDHDGRAEEVDGERYDAGSGLPLQVRRRRDGAAMVLFPGGSFRLGEPGRERTVRLPPAFLDRYPVTVSRFERFLLATGHPAPPAWRDHRGHQLARPERPVVFLSWQDADAYGRWVGAELPGEDLWEAAARGPGGARFPWGDGPPDPRLANLNYDPAGRIGAAWERTLEEVDRHPAGASPFGVEDLVGNGFEWCADRARDEAGRAGRVRRGCPAMYGPRKALPLWSRGVRPVERIPNGDHLTGFRLCLGVGR